MGFVMDLPIGSIAHNLDIESIPIHPRPRGIETIRTKTKKGKE